MKPKLVRIFIKKLIIKKRYTIKMKEIILYTSLFIFGVFLIIFGIISRRYKALEKISDTSRVKTVLLGFSVLIWVIYKLNN